MATDGCVGEGHRKTGRREIDSPPHGKTSVRAMTPVGDAPSRRDRKSLPSQSACPSVDDAGFKIAMRQVAASVSVVTARSGATRNGLTVTAVCSVSVEPPTLLVCLNRNASAERLVAESGAFAVNFLAEEQHVIARLFSTSKLNPEQRFAEGRWVSLRTGSPILDGALANFDCLVERCIPFGTHNLFLGRVVAVRSLDADGLIHRDGGFRRLTPQG